jgi:hypothetical protein
MSSLSSLYWGGAHRQGAAAAEAAEEEEGHRDVLRSERLSASPAPAVQYDTGSGSRRSRNANTNTSSLSDHHSLNHNPPSKGGGGEDGGGGGGAGGGGQRGQGGGGESRGDVSAPLARRHSESDESGRPRFVGQRFVVVANFTSVHHFIRDANKVFRADRRQDWSATEE